MKATATPTSTEAFKTAMQCFAGAVTIVTGRSSAGERLGMTATAVMSLSATPPSLIVSLNRESRLGRTLALGAHIGVNILHDAQAETAHMFGGSRRDLEPAERFGTDSWTDSENGVPLLRNTLVQMECVVDTAVARATHFVFFCAVERVEVSQSKVKPLLYFQRDFTTLDLASFDV